MKPGQTFDLSDKHIQSLEQDGSTIWDAQGQNVSGDEPEAQPSQPSQSTPPPPLARPSGPSARSVPAASAPTAKAEPPKKGPESPLSKPAQAFVAPVPKGAPVPGTKAAPETKPKSAPPKPASVATGHSPQRGQAPNRPGQTNRANRSASQSALIQAAQRLNQQRSYRWLAVLILTLAGLFFLLLIADTLTSLAGLFAVSRALGLLASFLLLAALASLAVLLAREWRALARMSRQRHLRQLTEAALFETGAPGAKEAMAAVEDSYAKQDETAWLVAQFRELAPSDAYNAVDRLEVFEREVLRKLDSQAVDLIEENARNTAIITTISPFAMFDALFTLWRNLRMIRQVATVYGVAPGFWGSMRLLRQVFANVLLTGGLEAADGALNQLLGGSLTAKLSTKLSEGLVNGMLSARLGLAAMDQCRPLPFKHNRRPRLSDIGGRLVTSVRKSIMKSKDER